jgi:hypothetical protein
MQFVIKKSSLEMMTSSHPSFRNPAAAIYTYTLICGVRNLTEPHAENTCPIKLFRGMRNLLLIINKTSCPLLNIKALSVSLSLFNGNIDLSKTND